MITKKGQSSFMVAPMLPLDSPLGRESKLLGVLRSERSRADRTGSRFSLLSFQVSQERRRRGALSRLVNHLRKRSRCMDSLGVIEEKIVWLVLPGCSAASADKLGLQVSEEFSTNGVRISYQVFHYSAAAKRARGDRGEPGEPGTGGGGEMRGDRSGKKPDPSSKPALCDSDHHAHSLDLLLVQPTPLWKRLLDMIVAGMGLIVLAPMFALIGLVIAVTSPGPIVFSQWRSGRGGIPFRIYKFRSMKKDAEAQRPSLIGRNERDGPAFKMERDPRVTRVGRVLRRMNLDELPQLWNVLLGQMSLVGPRPLPCEEAVRCDHWQQERLHVAPGITCFWQATKHRTRTPFCEWMRMDIRYVRSRSLLVDLKLIAQTAVGVVREAMRSARG